jgi:NADPH2 dehydrogenase
LTARLFDPFTVRGVRFRNRIVMSPMCTHSATADGQVSGFHHVHYGARALGGAGLVMVESSAVQPNGVLGAGDIGIWDDAHVPGLAGLVDTIHDGGALAAAQLGHSGRKLERADLPPVAPSPIPYDDGWRVPEELTSQGIADVVAAYSDAARRAALAGFDVVEVHAAHGYLLNEFLSPLANRRTDGYGGSAPARYRLLREVIDAVRGEWDGPLFVRVSAHDWAEGGSTPEDYLLYAEWMKEQGVDLVDVSTSGILPGRHATYPGFQVPAAELIRRTVGIPTGAVGFIDTGRQAEEIVRNGRADLVFVGRAMLTDPFWARTAADELRIPVEVPPQYTRYGTAWLTAQPRPTSAPAEATVAAYPATPARPATGGRPVAPAGQDPGDDVPARPTRTSTRS